MKKALASVIIVLLFSTLCLTLTTQNVSSKPQDIKILSYSHYIDSIAFLEIVGEIQNIGTATIERAVLTVTVYGEDGTNQGNVTGYAWLSYMAPQQKSPFRLDIEKPVDYDNWYMAGVSKIDISVKEAKENSSHLYSDFEISVNSAGVSTSEDDQGTYWVEGVVRNVGSHTASNLAVAAVYYNSLGTVVAVGRTDYLTPRNVAPSEVAPFKVGAYDTDQLIESDDRKIYSYALFAEATSPLTGGDAPVATAPVTGSATSQSGNPGSSPNQLIYILVVVVVAFAVFAALIVLRKRKSSTVKTGDQTKPVSRKKQMPKK